MDWSSDNQIVKMCLIGKCFFIKPWSECRTQGPVYSLFVHFLSRFWAMAQNPDPCVQYLNCKSHMITWTPVFKLILILAIRYSDGHCNLLLNTIHKISQKQDSNFSSTNISSKTKHNLLNFWKLIFQAAVNSLLVHLGSIHKWRHEIGPKIALSHLSFQKCDLLITTTKRKNIIIFVLIS